MSKGKRVKKKAPFVDIYGVLLLVATLVMSIGYAEIVGTTITVETKAEASSQEGVFITDVVCNEPNSVSNNYLATTLDSSITLDSPTDTKSFTITIYNKTVKPYVFVGVKKLDKWDEFTGVYNNTNISYTFGDDMVPHETIVKPKDWIVFNVDLGFNGQGQMPETLRSLINFSFQEVPTLEIVSEDKIENMYPNCEEKVYEFTVSNQRQNAEHGTITNGVPLTYTIAPNVLAPLTAKIYDENGTEVAGNKAITISSENAEEQIYTMKVKWDNTNPENGKEYNSAEYAGKTLASSINIIATPDIIDDNDKYIGYTLDKAKPVEITTAPMYFDVTTDKTTVEMNNTNNAEKIILTVKNNDGAQKINSFPVEYKLSIDNSKFTLLVDGSELGEEALILGNTATISQPHEIQLISKTGQELEATENCNLTIEAISPYAKTETIELILKDSTGPTAPVIVGGSTGSYALNQTISVSELSTDVGTGINKYQYLLNADGTKTAEATADVTTTATSQTFTEDAPGYYVYFRAVDKAGNVGEWSNAQQIYIDTQKPTVTPKQASVTITEGENYNLADYFTVVPNGTNTNYTVECTINGTKYTTTESIPAGTHTVTCTATKVGGNSSSTTMKLVVEKALEILAETTTFTDDLDNTYVVPGGFGVRTDLATTVDKGIVIEDSDGNQFVWVPIGDVKKTDGSTVNIELGRYTFNTTNGTPTLQQSANEFETEIGFNGFKEETVFRNSNFSDTNATAYDLKSWINSAKVYGGYYLARTHGTVDGTMGAEEKGSQAITSQKAKFTGTTGQRLRQGDASIACRNLYAGNEYNNKNFVQCDLTNSYAWDTAIVFASKCSNNSNIANSSSGTACNMRLIVGDLGDSTTETCTRTTTFTGKTPVTVRATGHIWTWDDSDYQYVAFRSESYVHDSEQKAGFRGTLTITIPPATAADVAAEPATYYGASVNYEDPAGDPNVGWKIFHSDGDNIYLIADDYVHYTYVPEETLIGSAAENAIFSNITEYGVRFSEDLTEEEAINVINDSAQTNPNVLRWISEPLQVKEDSDAPLYYINVAAEMLKTSVWDPIWLNASFAEYSIGGPTVEMFVDAAENLIGEELLKDFGFKDGSEGYGYYFDMEGTLRGLGDEELARLIRESRPNESFV